MKNTNIPENYADLLEVAKRASCLHWSRDARRLTMIVDDMPADRRTCLEFAVDGLRLEVRTLCKYDAVKNVWPEYCQPAGRFAFENKRGGNAFFLWIREQCQRETGWPNPQFLSLHKLATTAV